MKLDQLQHLVAIVEHGSLRAASRRLQLPQPALTRSIRALEKDLGEALFLRETTGMVLTAAGQRFHVRASAILHEARRAREEMAQCSGDDRGTVVAALSIMPHMGMLPHSISVFRQRYPRVQLNLIEGLFPDVERGLREGAIDFYIGATPRAKPASGLTIEHLFDNTRAVVCRKNHPLAASRTLKSLADADWAITAVDYNAEDDIDRLFDSNGLPAPRVLLRVRSAMSIMVALASTDLLAMLPVQCSKFPLIRDALHIIPVRETLPAPAIVQIRRPDMPLTPAAEFFADVLRRHGPQPPAGRAPRKATLSS